MAEQITLTTPVSQPSQTLVKIDHVKFDIRNLSVEVRWFGDGGIVGSAVYPTPAPAGSSQPTGQTLISQINTGNNSAGTSMAKKILQRLQTDGYLAAGNVTGTPD